MRLGQTVEVHEEAGRIVIEPLRTRPRYRLVDLVAQCDRKTQRTREEREWLNAPPVGRELL